MATRYVARVELHDASPEEYDVLHEEMEKEGYGRTVSLDGATHHLPTGLYITGEAESSNDALKRAKRAADGTGNTSSIVVIQTEHSLTTKGLEKVDG